MCGIGGILRVWPAEQRELALRTPHAESIPEAWLNILDDSIRHRGPDGQGRFRDRALRADGCVVDVAFVHRRLSIIDHAGGAQPMVSLLPLPDGSEGGGEGSFGADRAGLAGFPLLFHGKPNAPVEYRSIAPTGGAAADCIAVIFNGCIYNHRDLRAELLRAGHVFTTDHSDTEVLVHGWREWQSQWPVHVEGMFAMASWSRRDGLMLATDHYGEKPLWKALWRLPESPGRRFGSTLFGFASSAAALLELLRQGCPAVDVGYNALRSREMSEWLQYGYGASMLGVNQRIGFGIEALEPSSTLHFDMHTGSLSAGRYEPLRLAGRWLERQSQVRPPRSDAPSADAVETALLEAVRVRVEADVPLGCFLSGGVDSSLIAAMMKRTMGSVRTFTVSMPDPRYNESPFAASAAAAIGSTHEELPCEATPAHDLHRLITQIGIPFGDSSLLPTHWVSRAAREHVRVAFSGDGADELFAGYERLQACRVLRKYGSLVRLVPVEWWSDVDPRSRRTRMARLIRAAHGDGFEELVSVFPSTDLANLVSGEVRSVRRAPMRHPRARAMLARANQLLADPTRAAELDIKRYLPGDILTKLDSAAMSVGLETRCPYLDTGIASIVRWASLNSLMPRGQRKGLLRQVARKYLPAEIVDRPKMGFAIPIGEWFRSDYGGLRTMLLDHLNSTEPFGPPSLGIDLNMKFIRQMLDEHLGTGMSGRVKRDHSQRLYMLLVLSIWAKWLGGLKSSTPA